MLDGAFDRSNAAQVELALGDTVARGARLALIRPNATVWRVFVLTGLSHSFHSFGRLDEALASFALRP
jgi:anti-anti-sigma regulatory factor